MHVVLGLKVKSFLILTAAIFSIQALPAKTAWVSAYMDKAGNITEKKSKEDLYSIYESANWSCIISKENQEKSISSRSIICINNRKKDEMLSSEARCKGSMSCMTNLTLIEGSSAVMIVLSGN